MPVRDSDGSPGLRIQPVDAISNLLYQEGDAANETETKNLLHRRAKGIDVGSLAATGRSILQAVVGLRLA